MSTCQREKLVFFAFLFTSRRTYFGQIDFAIRFHDDGFDAWREHFAWIAPSAKREEMHQ